MTIRMPIDPLQLLKQLEPAIRPGGASGTERSGRVPLEQQSFAEMLQLVSRGGVSSGRAVTVGPEVAKAKELDEDQLARLAAAADLAEASGVRRAVMLMDGRGLIMDVAAREVTAELSAGEGSRIVDIEAAVYVAGEDEPTTASVLPYPGTGLIPRGALDADRTAGGAVADSEYGPADEAAAHARKAG